MLEIALLTLTLTLTADGEHRLTLTEAENLAECQETKAVLTEILTDAGVEIIAARCGETNLRLTPFEHGAGPDAEIHRYRVEIGSDGRFGIQVLDGQAPCTPKTDATPAIYCTRSSQKVITSE